ncbi:MAG TPA: ribosome small subunit-dependent GTPase A [Syntrophomonadaceae bacterium]|nr:ribosome small subunit-dependent GTPase A [Syntrophomonadaceae bacterium]
MHQGLIVKGYGGFYFVQSDRGICRCRGRGRLKMSEQSLLVGDHVLFTLVENGSGVIERVLPRKNTLSRPPVANVDQAILVFALANPEPDLKLLDRLLILCEVERISILICFNKADLVSGRFPSELAGIYRSAGYEVIFTSAVKKTGIESLREKVKGKISVVAGPSGAGKSTLLNALEPGMALKTGEISSKLKRGRHTTRHVELLPVAGGFIADTPGFSNLYLPDMKRTELGRYFPEISDLAGQCRFLDCLHYQEPDCAVKAAIDKGIISRCRYQNYVTFLAEVMARERIYE